MRRTHQAACVYRRGCRPAPRPAALRCFCGGALRRTKRGGRASKRVSRRDASAPRTRTRAAATAAARLVRSALPAAGAPPLARRGTGCVDAAAAEPPAKGQRARRGAGVSVLRCALGCAAETRVARRRGAAGAARAWRSLRKCACDKAGAPRACGLHRRLARRRRALHGGRRARARVAADVDMTWSRLGDPWSAAFGPARLRRASLAAGGPHPPAAPGPGPALDAPVRLRARVPCRRPGCAAADAPRAAWAPRSAPWAAPAPSPPPPRRSAAAPPSTSS